MLRSIVFSVVSLLGINVCLAKEPVDWTPLLTKATEKLEDSWTTTGNWKLADGVATLTPREGEKGWKRYSAYLWSKEKYTNFTIKFEYMVEPRGNSGFYFRVADVNEPVQTGVEVQIYDSAHKTDKAKLNDHDSGGIIPGVPPTASTAKPAGEWNEMVVTHNNRDVTVLLNGKQVNKIKLPEEGRLAGGADTGPIGFQDHGLPLKLRNIVIRELP